ncbi:hypothetical protein OOU_Y34scaffold00590g97 [Pyricularia oryzae Y34]|uniref:Uncharacterized protein n=2 Tax=Pyricularia oryzae TaxID=318829 RepID=A0AA97PK51_PYRO3|nr:hypothetical protein OOU_Y34scaffold00590g97 [Pyricularia oryzae Y34]
MSSNRSKKWVKFWAKQSPRNGAVPPRFDP